MKLKFVDDCRYSCDLGDFYKIFAQNDRSWEFRAKKILNEEEMIAVLEAIRELKGLKTLKTLKT